jgi:hypothetical protein
MPIGIYELLDGGILLVGLLSHDWHLRKDSEHQNKAK